MHSRARRASAPVALLLTAVFPAPASADEYCQETPNPTASVLVIHGGGWMGGSAAWGRDVCSPLAAMGYRVRSLEYPLWTVPGSIQYAREAADAEAARGRPVYATGVSAGGSIAEYLAVKSWIDGAVAIAPLSDFVNWRPPSPGFWGKLGMTPSMRYRYSPINNIERPARLRIIHSPQDDMVPYEQSVRMARRCGQACELITLKLGLGHISLGSRGPVLEWFAREARHPSFALERTGRSPVISEVAMRPRTFAPVSAAPGALGGRRGRRGRGTILRYTLSEAADVAVTIDRKVKGKRRARCTRRGAGRARCPLVRRAGGFTLQGVAGRNDGSFSGVISGRALRPGAYRAILIATSRSGRRSDPRQLTFSTTR